MKEKNQGITLIALIITIIIMLILVAVSISLALNSGLFKAAGKATQETNMAKDAEGELASGKVNIGGELYDSIDEYVQITEKGSSSKVIAKDKANNTKLNSNNVKEVVQTKTPATTYEAPIPVGFTVSGIESEQSIVDGLVIYQIPDGATVDWTNTSIDMQATYDQFVWIPISHEQINNMYICQAKTASNGTCNITVNAEGKAECQTHKTIDATKATLMAGRLYASDLYEKFEQGYTEVYKAGSGKREPDIVPGSYGTDCDNYTSYLRILNTILATSFAPTTDTTNNTGTANTDFKTYLQEEYNEIVKSVYENEGFYIGRYETSGMKSAGANPTIKVVAGSDNTTNAKISGVTWYSMYAQQKKYASNKGLTSVKSTMIQGAAYDQVMKFVENGTRPDGEPYTITTAENVAHSNFTTTPYQTGGRDYATNYTGGTVPYNDCVKNIYDLEGNVGVWTTEAYFDYKRVCRRGGLQIRPFGELPQRSLSELRQRRRRFSFSALRSSVS